MEIIPVRFEYQNAVFNGNFHKMHGEDGSIWYNLYIGEYIYGQLFNSQKRGWIFQSNRGMFEEQEMVDKFITTISAWNN